MLVYYFKNKLNGKMYIGKTIRTLEIRIREHGYDNSGCKYFKKAFKKYGLVGFDTQVICYANCIQELNILEKFWINFYNVRNKKFGYNIKEGGEGGKHADETKLRIGNSNKGKKLTQETKDKISDAHKGKKLSDSHKIAISIGNKGKGKGIVRSDETKEKLRKINLGKKMPDSMREKMRIRSTGNCYAKGYKHTQETIEENNKKARYRLPKNGKQFKGTKFHPKRTDKQFSGKIIIDKKELCLGYYNTEKEAAQAYNDAVDKYWNGEGYKNKII